MDVAAWLRRLGLEQYEHPFRENDIDGAVLPELTAEDLIGLGVTSIGHRRKLLAAIAALREGPAPSRDEADRNLGPALKEDPRGLASPTAERRQLTVMFCDLVGSTPLSARHDPEDLRAIIGAYHRCVAETVEGFDGFVARYMGDGVLIYFGYPQAHEDDAERAIRCGLALVERVPLLNQAENLHVRIGIATGLVVVGGEVVEHDVVGETPNLAARLQALAEPDTVVVAASTRRLVGDMFEYRNLGAVELKGIAAPTPAWQVLRPSAVESRFEALRGPVLSPLVGRDEEIDLLLRRWARAQTGDGQVVLISGEPGIGKSRISAELEERLRAEPHIRLRYFCSPYHQDSALYPFVDQLGRASGFAPDDPPAVSLAKLEALLARGAPADEDVAFIVDLLSLPASERHPLPNLSPQRKKERTLEALIRQLEGLARRQPVLMIFEDAHWVDPTSRELLDLTIERVRNLPVLVIVTFRPEFEPVWTGQPQVRMLTLNRLDRRDRSALVAQIAGGRALADAIVDQIVDRTDGVPLFIEELTKSVLESGAPLVGIPATLHDSLMARLDRLASVRLVAQIGAAIGREFSYALLSAVAHLPDSELGASLARLVASELVFQRGAPPEAVYTFKHALVQEAAHGSLLRSTRQQLHAQIADALEAHSPELVDTQPEIFAQHYAEAGLVEKSVAYWGQAGHRSAARSAMAEAAAQFQKGLDQLALLPDSRERQQQELEFWGALAAVLNAIKGPAAQETGLAYACARPLWDQLRSPSGYLHVPYGQSRYHMFRGEYDLALRLDDAFVRLSRERNDSGGLVLAHASCGRNLLFVGKFAMSRSHLEEALALYDPISHGSLVHQAGNYPHVGSQAYLGNALFCLGFPEQALGLSSAAVTAAQRLAHLPSLAANLAVSARLLSIMGDGAALGERADQLIAVTTERSFPFWRAQGTIYRGWAKVKNGDATEGISLLRSGLSAFQGTGAEMSMPHFIALLAGACAIARQLGEALALFEDALQIAKRTGELWFAAELYRHKGGLLLRQEDAEAAEELYHKALGIAEEQEAKMWELRAATSLARLWRDRGRHAKAHDLLSPIYNWFTEGFDTPDLKEAKALLDELE
ncbi:MAG: AAA family ATPase [Alphaproteobacteria bacterium]|nr:AAA family ATPase [Alphaproteobacteria bacterium]